jgi:hypothetical protein
MKQPNVKREYFKSCMHMSKDWLKESAANPSPYMKPIHVKLQLLAIRRKESVL